MTFLSRRSFTYFFPFMSMFFISLSSLSAAIPAPDHVVIVVEENHRASQIIGQAAAVYMNTLAAQGAHMTNSFGTNHPSQPNYLQLFSGSNQGVTTDNLITTRFTSANLGAELRARGKTFAGYSEQLPSVGSQVSTNLKYVRKHNPWANWQGTGVNQLPSTVNLPMVGYFPLPTATVAIPDYSILPTVSFVIPNLDHDMHDGSILAADQWLKKYIGPYVTWAQTHNSLLILTWDEDDFSTTNNNHIATVFVGPMVKIGKYADKITHHNVLRTIEDMYGLSHAGAAATALPITNIWTTSVTVPDTTPPTQPTNVAAIAQSAISITVSWTTSTDAIGVVGYDIYRGINKIGSTNGSTFSFLETGLSPSTLYSYAVQARDAAGNLSTMSTVANATTPSLPASGFLMGINLNGAAVTIDGHLWKSYATALASGLSFSPAITRAATTVTPSPATTTDTSAMLNSAVYSSSSWTLNQTVTNGNYNVYLWVMENYLSNNRSFNVQLEGVTVAVGIGNLTKGVWVKYGPYSATVADGSLNVGLIQGVSAPHLMGIEINTVSAVASLWNNERLFSSWAQVMNLNPR